MTQSPDALAIVGGTLIDGTGAPPVPDSVLLIEGGRIRRVGSRASVEIEDHVRLVDATGKFLIPGLIDTNVHLTLFGFGTAEFRETAIRYAPHKADLAIAVAQLHLRNGITTVRDSYGVLPICQAARAEIESGRQPGPRILAAGNILGWGGPFSVTFGAPYRRLANHGAGRLPPAEPLRSRVQRPRDTGNRRGPAAVDRR
jgi:imidazolonepropionase-like amidohydrolase